MRQLVTTADQLDETVEYFTGQSEFAWDVETTGQYRGVPAVNSVAWISLATAGHSCVIPLGHPNGYKQLQKGYRKKNRVTKKFETFPTTFEDPPPQLSRARVFDALKPLFFSDRLKIAHNLPFDALSIAKYYGAFPPPPYADTVVAAWLVDENRLVGLKTLLKSIYGLVYDREETGKCIENHPFGAVADYSYIDSAALYLLWQRLKQQISDEGVESIWALEMRVLHCLLHMQMPGAPVDVAALKALHAHLTEEISALEGQIYVAAGRIFNLASTPQKQKLFFEELGLTPKKFTDTGQPSTDAEAMEHHRTKHPVVSLYLDYQELNKIQSTYVEGYLGNEKKPTLIFNGKIYPSFKQHGTVTGRFSCSEPNVQNWPRPDTAIGKQIRDIIDCPPGFILLIADYAQIEQRILAHFAGPGALMQGFLDGIDAHTMTAAMIFGVAPEDVTKAMRQVAKAVAFAINYGAGAQRVADMAGISLRKAKQILALHMKVFPEIYIFKDKLHKTVAARRPTPYLRTLLGRKRRLPGLLSPKQGIRAQAERQLVNSLIQGSNADITKLAMCRFRERILPGMQLLLTVHDELAALCPEEIAAEGAEVMYEAMAGKEIQDLMRVPTVTDVKVCKKWSEAK